jgi:hypothetical protein
MDRFYSRYSEASRLLDMAVRECGLSELIDELCVAIDDEKMWQLYLFRVFDRSYNDFITETRGNIQTQRQQQIKEPEPEYMARTIRSSLSVVQEFNK